MGTLPPVHQQVGKGWRERVIGRASERARTPQKKKKLVSTDWARLKKKLKMGTVKNGRMIVIGCQVFLPTK